MVLQLNIIVFLSWEYSLRSSRFTKYTLGHYKMEDSFHYPLFFHMSDVSRNRLAHQYLEYFSGVTVTWHENGVQMSLAVTGSFSITAQAVINSEGTL